MPSATCAVRYPRTADHDVFTGSFKAYFRSHRNSKPVLSPKLDNACLAGSAAAALGTIRDGTSTLPAVRDKVLESPTHERMKISARPFGQFEGPWLASLV